MSFLENRIPPPIVLLLALVLMRMLAMFDSSTLLAFKHPNLVALGICAIGFASAVLGIISFQKAQTTIDPLTPERASQLVTSGIFKFSRNPMYLGMVLVAIAWAVHLSSAYSLIMVVAFALYITRFQIKPEERAMTHLFGDDFQTYTKSTRRWL